MKRRDLLKGFSFGVAAVAVSQALPPAAAAAPIATQEAASPKAALPPTKRLLAMRCAQCGAVIASALVDEFDATPDAICSHCYEKLENLSEIAEDDRRDDDAQEALENRTSDLKRLVKLHDHVDDVLRDLTYETHDERLRDRLRDVRDLMLETMKHVTVPS